MLAFKQGAFKTDQTPKTISFALHLQFFCKTTRILACTML